jgi:hypothetical protein
LFTAYLIYYPYVGQKEDLGRFLLHTAPQLALEGESIPQLQEFPELLACGAVLLEEAHACSAGQKREKSVLTLRLIAALKSSSFALRNA